MSSSPINPAQQEEKVSTPGNPGNTSRQTEGPSTPPEDALQALRTFASLREAIRDSKASLRELDAGPALVKQEILRLIAEQAQTITEADGVAIALAEGAGIVCRGRAGEIAPPLGSALDPNSGLTGTCFRTGTIVRCDDPENDIRVDAAACRTMGIQSLAAVPLRAAEGSCGVLAVFDRDSYAFTDSDIRSLNLLGELAVEALQPETEGSTVKVTPEARSEEPAARESAPAAALESGTALNEVPVLSGYAAPSPGRPWLRWVILGLWGAVAAALLVWWGLHRQQKPETAQPAQTTSATSENKEEVPPFAPGEAPKNAILPHVTGIRHWSDGNSSTVAIDLEDKVEYDFHRINSPDRIYVDLHDTLLNRELADRSFEVTESFVAKIRAAQTVPGVARIVIETKGSPNLGAVSMESSPYRLLIELRSPQAPPKPKLDNQTLLQTPRQLSFPEISPNPTREDLKLKSLIPKMRIVIDAGHGGWDLGTVGQKGLLEKDLALEVAQRAGVLLAQRLGVEVIYTRSDDTFIPLERRTAIANSVGADLFISVHANYSSEPTARGVETYYTSAAPSTQVIAAEERELGPIPELKLTASELKGKSDASRKLATSVQQSLYGTLAAAAPGVRNRGVKAASFVVLTGTTMPAVLAEISFVSSPADEQRLQNPFYRQQIAEALYRGIARYAAQSNKTKVAAATAHDHGF